VKIRDLTFWLLLASVFACPNCASNAQKEVLRENPPELVSVEAFLPAPVQNVYNRSCIACHGHDGHGITGIAPDLRQVAKRNSDEWLKYFSNPQSPHPGSKSPSAIWLTRDEIVAVAKFLSHEAEQPPDDEATR